MSSQRVYQYGTGIRTGPPIVCTGVSGGTALSAQTSGLNVFSVILTNTSGNSPVWIGGAGANAPVSGGPGIALYAGQSITLPIDNLADISVVAETSGQKVSWIGFAK